MAAGGLIPMSDHPNPEHRLELPTDPRATLALLERTAESWDAAWQPRGVRSGRLGLPVIAGVRRGWVAGEVEVEAIPDGSRLEYRIDASEYRVDKVTAVILSIAAVGAIITVVGPLFPGLVRLMPAGVMVALAAWLFIVGRLRNSGPEEFFADLRAESEAGAEPGEGNFEAGASGYTG